MDLTCLKKTKPMATDAMGAHKVANIHAASVGEAAESFQFRTPRARCLQALLAVIALAATSLALTPPPQLQPPRKPHMSHNP